MAYSDAEDDFSSDSDSEGSLVDFIVNDDDEPDVINEESDSEASELQEIVADLKADERQLLQSSAQATSRPRRTRKPVKRYIDPDYARLMEIDSLSQKEIDFIMNGDDLKEKEEEIEKDADKTKTKKKKLKVRKSVLKRRRKQSASAAAKRGGIKRSRGATDL